MSDNGQLHQRKAIFGKVPQELMHDLTITDGAVRLYAHMHWRYGRNRQMFEKLETIANWLGISERAVRDRILELEARDWIVVISRRNPASHTARVNKYHVFEDRQDALDFRAAPFDLGELDSVRQKSEVETRKARTGLGGIPSHKPKSTGTQVPTDNRNSSSNGEGGDNRNSSSKELEALQVLNQKHVADANASAGADPSNDADYATWKAALERRDPEKPIKQPRPRNEHFDGIVKAFGYDADKLSKSEATLIGKAASELKGVGVEAAQIGQLYAYIQSLKFPSFTAAVLPKYVSAWRLTIIRNDVPPITVPDDDTLRRQAEERATQYQRNGAGF